MTQLETTREDESDFVRFIVYPLLLIVYIGCLSLCVKKIIWNLRESKPIIKGLFAVNCCTFICRVVFFMDFSLHYSDELFFFLDYWPFFTTTTAAYVLVTSWLSLIVTIENADTAPAKIQLMNRGMLGLGFSIQLTYFVLYFGMFHGNKENYPIAIRLVMCFFELIAVVLLGYLGNKLINLVSHFWEDDLINKLRLMQIFGMSCFCCRLVINLVSLAISSETGYFVTAEHGYFWGCFLLFDYIFSEITFTFAVTSMIASQTKHHRELSSTSEESMISARLKRGLSK